MSDNIVQLVQPDPLDSIKQRLIDGHARLDKSHAEWVEGSIEIARALREGRDLMPADRDFSQWLKKNRLDFFGADARAALLGLANDEALAREVLTKSDSRSHIVIWREAKARFRSVSKPTTKPRGPLKRKRNSVIRANRAMKLGADTLARLAGTSLDRSQELDELVVLNRGVPPGEHTEIVRQLVADAIAGKAVSAIAASAKITGREAPSAQRLIDTFKHRMTFVWEQADKNAREALIYYLMAETEKAG
jgi:hypothetical protein